MVLFVYGPDTYRAQLKAQELINSFQAKRDQEGLNVVRLSGGQLDFDRLRQETLMQGFLAEKKMIVVDRLLSLGSAELHEAVLDFIKQFVKQKDDQNIILFVDDSVSTGKGKAKSHSKKLFELLKKQKFFFEFPELSGKQLEQWVQRSVNELGGVIDIDAAATLAARVGGNLWRMSNEINKLVSIKKTEPITQAYVNTHVDGAFEENIFALTDAIAKKNRTQALQLLTSEINNGANEMYILTMIVRQYRILLQMKDMQVRGSTVPKKVASELKIHPFVVQKSVPMLNSYSSEQLIAIYRRLLDIDERFKGQSPNPELLLDVLVVEN